MASLPSQARLQRTVKLGQQVAFKPFSINGTLRQRAAPALQVPETSHQQRSLAVRTRAQPEEKKVVYNTEFGYSRKDVFIICGALIGLGYAMYYGLQATGMSAGYAGNWVQAIVFLGICVGWVSTYLYRVATKQMTYVKQLEQYEEAVMRKRLEEMPEEELSALMAEAEDVKTKAQQGKQQ